MILERPVTREDIIFDDRILLKRIIMKKEIETPRLISCVTCDYNPDVTKEVCSTCPLKDGRVLDTKTKQFKFPRE